MSLRGESVSRVIDMAVDEGHQWEAAFGLESEACERRRRHMCKKMGH
jgi:hypothetical protein